MAIHIESHQRRALIVATFGLAAAFGSYWWLAQPSQSSQPLPETSSVAEAGVDSGTVPIAAAVVVDVEGAVRSPGVVELPAGSRVRDAVAAAGGLRSGAIPGINLARVLEDGEQIVLGKVAGSETSSDGRIPINSASQSQLEELPGVGPVLAARLIAYREEHGSFRNLAALDAVSGVGPAMLENLKSAVRFDG